MVWRKGKMEEDEEEREFCVPESVPDDEKGRHTVSSEDKFRAKRYEVAQSPVPRSFRRHSHACSFSFHTTCDG